MKPIYILSLANMRTGGPEAIHQLSDALIEQGFDARMVYYDFKQIAALERSKPDDFYAFGLRENTIEEYAHYKTRIEATAPNQEGYIIVLPETLCHLAPYFHRATVLIWWLSVDFGFAALSKINLNHLRAKSVLHATQSQYARRFLETVQLLNLGLLSDYTVDLTEHATPRRWRKRKKQAVFNVAPHKVNPEEVAHVMQAVTRLDPEITVLPARGSRSEMALLFAESRVYVDLGTFPGKDRMPREATSMGCANYLRHAGAANIPSDFMVSSYCLSDAESIVRLATDHDTFDFDVDHRTMCIAREREDFNTEVNCVFGYLMERERIDAHKAAQVQRAIRIVDETDALIPDRPFCSSQ